MMKTIYTFLLMLFLLIAVTVVHAQLNNTVSSNGITYSSIPALKHAHSAITTLNGRITDPTGKGLEAVSIYIPELEKRTITDDQGMFTFSNVRKGIITLECSHISYLTVVQTVDLNNNQNTLTIQLEPTTKMIEEVVVTSNQTKLAGNIPYTVSSVPHSDLVRSGQNTMIETLSEKPGIDIISGGSGIGKPVIRGLSFSRIVLYSMGTKVENQQWDDDHDAGVGEAGIDRVEVVYGPSALIYGADAMGGAIVFIDEKNPAAGKTTGHVNLGLFSNTHGINLNAGIKHTSKSGLFYGAYFTDQSHTDYLQGNAGLPDGFSPSGWSSGRAVNSRFHNLSGKARIGISRGWGVSKLTYSYLRSLTGMIVEKDEDSLATAKGDPYIYTSRMFQSPYQDVNIHVISSENTFLTGHSKWNLNTAYQVNNRKEFESLSAGDRKHLSLGLLLHTFTSDVKWTSNKEKNFVVTLGAQGMFQKNTNYGNNIAVPDAIVNDFATYGLFHFNSGKWNFLGGIRFDIRSVDINDTKGVYEGEATLDSMEQAALNTLGLKRNVTNFKKNYYPFNFSSGATYHLSKNVLIKLNFASGFRAPNYAELSTFGKHEGTTRFETGNPDLKMEQNLEGDINTSWDLNDFSLNVSGFVNHVKNYIYLSPAKDSVYDLQVIAYKQNDANIYGGEMSVTFHPQSLKFMELRSSIGLNSGRLSGGGYLPYFPANKTKTELKFSKDSFGKLNRPYVSLIMKNYFAQNHPALYETSTPGYTLFDIFLGTDIRVKSQPVHISLFATNILNKAYFNHLSIVKDIGVYERGRNMGVQVQVEFGR